MPGISGTLFDETYDLGVLAADDPYALALPYATAFLLDVAPPPPPTIGLFPAFLQVDLLARDLDVLSLLLVSTLDIPARDLSVSSAAGETTIEIPARPLEVTSVVPVGTVEVPARDLTITSAVPV